LVYYAIHTSFSKPLSVQIVSTVDVSDFEFKLTLTYIRDRIAADCISTTRK